MALIQTMNKKMLQFCKYDIKFKTHDRQKALKTQKDENSFPKKKQAENAD